MSYSQEKIEEIKDDITRVKGVIKSIDDKISERIELDIAKYETQSDIGRRRVDRTPISDLRKLKSDYKKELSALVRNLLLQLRYKAGALKELLHELEMQKLAGKRVGHKIKETQEDLENTQEDIKKYAPARRGIKQIRVRF